MNSVVLVVATILIYVNAAPVNQKCPTNDDLFAYCNQTPNTSLAENGVNELYIESDELIDVLLDLCLNYNDVVS